MIYLKLKGGLGNQMFEYATARCIQEKSKDEIVFITKDLNQNEHDSFALSHFNIKECFKINNKSDILFKIVCALNVLYFKKCKNGEKKLNNLIKKLAKFGLYITIFDNPDYDFKTKNKTLEGYFQNKKYFDEIRDILLEEFQVKDPIMEINKKIYQEIKTTNSVCLHIRRGDFINNNTHEVCDLNYYNEAIKLMNKKIEKAHFFVFSDDIEWVKENIKGKNFTYVENNNPAYEDLRLMYSCQNFILSNSSFSWWAQYLAQNNQKVVIAPSRWYKANDQYDLKEKNWLIIETN